ncbi:MAG: septum formation initiator family protein [Clostridia bacterium]|nr:septum formation initiator family protein [Clostridia bacterium]
MKKRIKTNKIYKKLLILGILIYVAYIFIGQQKTLNSYKNTQDYYTEQLNMQLAYQESLNKTKSNIDSKEYIEKIAREKLDMYLPNERVYIDKGN